MLWYTCKRLLMLVPVAILVSIATFALLLAVPGDPAAEIAGPNATEAQIALVRERLGLDQSILQQYLSWLGGVVQGDFGTSLSSVRPVTEMVVERLPVTLSLAFVALLLGTVFGVLLGTIAAFHKGRLLDRFLTIFASLGIATPNYWLGLLLILAFSLTLGWFPSAQYVPIEEGVMEWGRHLVLPGLALGAAFVAETTRQVRSAVLEVKDLPYITTAKAQGMLPRAVIGKYIAKNAAVPVLTVIGLQFTRILSGTVLIEQIFGLPGIGTLMISAVLGRDMPVVQGVMFGAVMVAVLMNLLVDLSYAALNPKVRTQWS
ncbi:ABC transporter permease [Nocardioides sp. Bht2]|uniref:ABC transporter permease n=1 Tax=Nocardioides sp. Bht2 TaxID=3392297 RepID=UPI0039B46221